MVGRRGTHLVLAAVVIAFVAALVAAKASETTSTRPSESVTVAVEAMASESARPAT